MLPRSLKSNADSEIGREKLSGRDGKGRFTKGNAGRPKGSLNKLSEAFIAELCEDFAQHGASAIRRVRKDDPSTYLRVVAGLLPKQAKIEIEGGLPPLKASELSDDQLLNLLAGVAIVVNGIVYDPAGLIASDEPDQPGRFKVIDHRPTPVVGIVPEDDGER